MSARNERLVSARVHDAVLVRNALHVVNDAALSAAITRAIVLVCEGAELATLDAALAPALERMPTSTRGPLKKAIDGVVERVGARRDGGAAAPSPARARSPRHAPARSDTPALFEEPPRRSARRVA